MPSRFLWILATLLLFLLGCEGPPAPWSATPAWIDGEQAHYNVRLGEDLVVGTMTTRLRATDEGWVLQHETSKRGAFENGEVTLSPAFAPRATWHEHPGGRSEVVYSEGRATLTITPKDKKPANPKTIDLPADFVDDDTSLMVFRGVKLPEGGQTAVTVFVPKSGVAVPITLEAGPIERITVPAGAFDARCLRMRFASIRQKACYATQAPNPLVLYENPASKTTIELRAFQPGKDAAWQGDPAPPSVSRAPVPPNWGFVATSFLISMPLMLVLPLWLGFRLKKRLGTPLALWGAGALSFVASQIVHLPLNYALGFMGAPRALGRLPMPWLAIALGLSAGLCEELARFVAWRFVLKKRGRTYAEALAFGVGHGGIEAMLVGLIALLNVVVMIFFSFTPPDVLGIPPDQAGALDGARDAFWLAPAYLGAISGVERVFAMILHVACSVLVVRAVARKQPVWLVAAIGLHALMDAGAVIAIGRWGPLPTEAVVGAFALLSAIVVWKLREPLAAPTKP